MDLTGINTLNSWKKGNECEAWNDEDVGMTSASSRVCASLHLLRQSCCGVYFQKHERLSVTLSSSADKIWNIYGTVQAEYVEVATLSR